MKAKRTIAKLSMEQATAQDWMLLRLLRKWLKGDPSAPTTRDWSRCVLYLADKYGVRGIDAMLTALEAEDVVKPDYKGLARAFSADWS